MGSELPESQAKPPTGRENIPALTSLRMIAAGLVFVHHYPPSHEIFWRVISNQGHVGVTGFFVLSGFLIVARYFEAWTLGRLRLRDYLKMRAARILPLYYVVFVSSLLISKQPLAITGARLPEWTLTQGLYWDSLFYGVVPTSWSLTVEECFYLLAPLLFLLIARAGALRHRSAWVAILAITTVVLFAVGLSLLQFSRVSGLAQGPHRFLASDTHLVIYTIFGRFFDFGVGMACGLAYLRGDLGRLWSRPRGTTWATALFVVSAVGVVAALFLMTMAGGLAGSPYQNGWRYNFAVAVLAALAIAALTCPTAWSSRALALRPLVYLGQISYALYLVQMAPLGVREFLAPATDIPWLRVLVLYAGLSVLSAILYEAVEKPARRWILSIGGHRLPPPPRPC